MHLYKVPSEERIQSWNLSRWRIPTPAFLVGFFFLAVVDSPDAVRTVQRVSQHFPDWESRAFLPQDLTICSSDSAFQQCSFWET